MKFVESHSNDPYYNLSFEEYIFKNLPLEDEEYVYLWQNEPSIIIGTNQNAYNEINDDYVKEHNLKVVRRITGGGAVYHDLGNLNFSFITKTKGSDKIDFKKYYVPIVDALQAIGVNAELSGRNDVTVDGKKCIGASQSVYKHRVLSNGCILFDVELTELANALKVRKEKLEGKGVKSVKARVTNIRPYLEANVTVEEFKEILKQKIFEQLGEEPQEYILSEEELEGVKHIHDTRFSLHSWNYGRNPHGTIQTYTKLPAGAVELSFDLQHGRIKHLMINGDFFGKEDIADVEQLLEGTDYKASSINAKLETIAIEDYFGKVEQKDIVQCFFKEQDQK